MGHTYVKYCRKSSKKNIIRLSEKKTTKANIKTRLVITQKQKPISVDDWKVNQQRLMNQKFLPRKQVETK